MKKLLNLFRRKKKHTFTGFEIKFWIKGKLMTECVSHPYQIFEMYFPYGCRFKEDGYIISGFRIEPFTERIQNV